MVAILVIVGVANTPIELVKPDWRYLPSGVLRTGDVGWTCPVRSRKVCGGHLRPSVPAAVLVFDFGADARRIR